MTKRFSYHMEMEKAFTLDISIRITHHPYFFTTKPKIS